MLISRTLPAALLVADTERARSDATQNATRSSAGRGAVNRVSAADRLTVSEGRRGSDVEPTQGDSDTISDWFPPVDATSQTRETELQTQRTVTPAVQNTTASSSPLASSGSTSTSSAAPQTSPIEGEYHDLVDLPLDMITFRANLTQMMAKPHALDTLM